MSSVDDRIVNMQFNNKQFTQGVTESQQSLSGLEKSLQNTAKTKGLEALGASADGLKHKFSVMQIAGVSAIATIASKATAAGIGLVKSLTIDPITSGFQEYQTNLNSIQTVMSNTGLVGEKGMKKVNTALDELNHFSDLTIYNFSQMARNVGTFTAAGVKLKPAVSAIKGIANLAALSGSNSQQASTAMYQLSQAIAAGRVNLQDWNSVVNAGMGGKQFQTALARTAVAMGKISASSVKVGSTVKVLGKSFRESIGGPGAKWLDSKILVQTLNTLDGRFSKSAMQLETNTDGTRKYTDAQIEARIQTARLSLAQKEGIKFSDKQFAAVRKQADAAFNSATQIKTLPQLFGVVQESLGSIWSTTFRGIFGTYTQSVSLWGKVGGVIQKGTNTLNLAFTNMITTWADSGRRADFIKDLGTALKSVGSILGAMKGAFTEVFPPHAGQTLIILTDHFTSFVNSLVPSKKTLDSLHNIFIGVFSVLHIGVSIVKAIAAGFGAFFGQVAKGSGEAGGGILAFVGHIGLLLQKLDKFLTSGGKMTDIFKGIGTAAGVFAGQGIQIATNIIQGLIKGLSGGALGSLKGVVEKLANYIPDTIKNALGIHSPSKVTMEIGQNIIQGLVDGITKGISFIFKSIGLITSAIMGGFKQMFGDMDALDFASVINAFLTGGLLFALMRTTNSIRTAVSQTFGALQNTLQTFQQGIKAKALLNIAIAVGILTASLVALSLIDPKKMAKGLGGMAAMLAMLVGSLAVLSKISKGDNKQSMIELAGSIFLISTAMVAMATAVAILGHLDLKSLAKGVGAMALIMGIMTASMMALGGAGKVALGAGPALIAMAIAMNLLAGAIALFGNMDLGTLAKGMSAVGLAMAIFTASLAILSKTGGKGAAAAGAGILMAAGAMLVLSTAVLAFGKMNLKTLAKGFGAVAIAMAIFTAALAVLGSNAAGTLAAGAAMVMLATAMGMLVPVIAILGNMDMGTLAKGLTAMGIALGLFVVAVAALGVVGEAAGPGLLMVGGALALIGLGMAAFGTGFALLAAAGTAGIAVMTAAITAFILLLPNIAIQIAAAFVTFIQTLAAAAPKIRAAFSTIFAQMLGVVADAIPQIGSLISLLVSELLRVLNDAIPQAGTVIKTLITTLIGILKHSAGQWIDAGWYIIDKFLSGIDGHVDGVIKKGTDIVVKLIEGFGKSGARIVKAVGDTIFKFLNALDAEIIYYTPKIVQKGKDIAKHLVEGFATGLVGADNVGKVKGAVKTLVDIAKVAFTGPAGFIIKSPSKVTREYGRFVGEGLAAGIDDSGSRVGRSATRLGRKVTRNIAFSISSGIKSAVAAASSMANAVIAAGDPNALVAQRGASSAQRAAFAAQARADLAKADARRAKGNPKRAKKLKKLADRAQSAADAAQARADAAAQRVSDIKDFDSSDLHTKGDKMNEQATALAEQSQKMLEKANAEAAKANALMRTNVKAGRAMRLQAQRDATAAAALAASAMRANNAANSYYAQEVLTRADAIDKARKAEDQARADQEAYDAADTQGKVDILNKRIAEQQAKADAANANAAALLASARAKAATNAAGAMADLDASEQAAQDAKDAADAAQQAKDQLAQLLGQDGGGSAGDGSSMTQPSKSVLEDAASVVDRYTASLAAAQEAAASAQPVIQFVQNNTSPVALTASEIYRQTNNLLSAQELKMGVNSS